MKLKDKIISFLDRLNSLLFIRLPLQYCHICGKYVYDFQERYINEELQVCHQKCYNKYIRYIDEIKIVINLRINDYLKREQNCNDCHLKKRNELKELKEKFNRFIEII